MVCRLVHKTVTGTLRIPNFEQVVDIVRQVYADVEPNKGGQNAQYIPQLAEVSMSETPKAPIIRCCAHERLTFAANRLGVGLRQPHCSIDTSTTPHHRAIGVRSR